MDGREWVGVPELGPIELTGGQHAAWLEAVAETVRLAGERGRPEFRPVVAEPPGRLLVAWGPIAVMSVPPGEWRFTDQPATPNPSDSVSNWSWGAVLPTPSL